ncbi:MAG TPA: helix-hairpin-helix domain-containing protein [Bacteroidales bacterium]|nr:helix-hairpin-helix domain-containing protein [Bacteroidales bacterium]
MKTQRTQKFYRISSAPSASSFAFFALKVIIYSFLLLFSISAWGQDRNSTDIISSIAEQLAADDSDPEAVQVYTEKLSDLADDPVNINSASADELSRLFFLTDFQVKALADYSHSTGRIFSVYELANIPGFDRSTAEMMVPFISLQTASVQPAIKTSLNNTILASAIYKSSLRDTSEIGSPIKLMSRYRFFVSGFSGGFTAEKDPGERLFPGKPPVPDFLSGYLSWKGNGFIKKILIGDFSGRFGQGTSVNTGSAAFLSLTAPSFMSARTEIKPYTSSDENNFFRGASVELGLGDFTMDMYYSINEIDASYDPESETIKSLYTPGLHNTPGSLLKKDVLRDKSSGINISYNFKNFRAGLLGTADRLSIPLQPDNADPEKNFAFAGDRTRLLSFYYNALLKRILLFGEVTADNSHNKAFVQGLSIRLSDRLIVNGLVRNYGQGYFSFHGKGPGGSPGNDNTISANFRFEAAKHLFICGGSEVKNYPWLKFRSSSPSRAMREELRVIWTPSEYLGIEGLYNFRFSMNDDQETTGIPSLEEMKTDYFRASVKYSLADNLAFTSRIDYKKVRHEGFTGALMLQDFSYTFRKLPLSLWARYCMFRTDSWDARLYAYENDLLYGFNIPALSGNGTRIYMMLKYKTGNYAEVRIKYGLTSVQDKKNEQDLRVQLRVNF